MRHKFYFTLVELLVVISIIAILASMLLPALRKAKDLAKQIKCTSTIDQFGKASMFYANDHNSYSLPVKINTGPASYRQWYKIPEFRECIGLKDPVTEKVDLDYVCPKSRAAENVDASGQCGMGGSYGFNFTGISVPSILNPDYLGYRLTNVHTPSQKVQMGDAVDWFIKHSRANDYVGEVYKSMAAAYRHRKQMNVLFFDGHVATVKDSILRNVNNPMWDPYK